MAFSGRNFPFCYSQPPPCPTPSIFLSYTHTREHPQPHNTHAHVLTEHLCRPAESHDAASAIIPAVEPAEPTRKLEEKTPLQ